MVSLRFGHLEQVAQNEPHTWTINAASFLFREREHALVERLRLGVAAKMLVERCERAKRGLQRRVVGTLHFFHNSERAPQQRFRLGVAMLRLVEVSQLPERVLHIRVAWATHTFHVGEPFLAQGLSLAMAAKLHIK